MSGALPPNQVATRLFPVIGERDPEPFDESTWDLVVDGLVAAPLRLSFADLAGMRHATQSGTIHCVTRWSRAGATFSGVRVADLLARTRPLGDAAFVRFVSGRGHDTSLPLADAGEALVADALGFGGSASGPIEPGPIAPEHGGPVRSVLLSRYFYKSVKWLRRIEVMAADQLGFWERTAGYHNGADPWREERYITRDIDPRRLKVLLDARDLAGQDLLGADLAGALLEGFRLESANLRNASLRGANLRGADLRDVHLCNADLREADLQQALIDGIDLDGADLRGADLRGARGVPASLAAAQLTDAEASCRVDGLDWNGTPLDAVLADQLAYLRERGVLRQA